MNEIEKLIWADPVITLPHAVPEGQVVFCGTGGELEVELRDGKTAALKVRAGVVPVKIARILKTSCEDLMILGMKRG